MNTPSDVLSSAVIGVTIPLVAFRMITPNEVFPVTYHRGSSAHLDIGGRRGQAIHRALEDQLGVQVAEIKPFGLSGSAGSTPMRVRVKGEPETWLFAKLYAGSHLRSDRWYKLGRTLLYGRLEDEKPFNTVRPAGPAGGLRPAADARGRGPQPGAVRDRGDHPEREYLVVTEFFDDAQEIGDLDQVDDGIIDDGLRIIRHLWDAGLAHRDIKPANLLVRDGRVHLIDVFFAEVRLLAPGGRPGQHDAGPGHLLQLRAGLPAGPAPVQRRRDRRGLRRHQRHHHALPAPQDHARPGPRPARRLPPPAARVAAPIAIQRWSIRRVGLMIGVALLALLALLTALSSFGAAGLLRRSSCRWPWPAWCWPAARSGRRRVQIPRGHEPTCTYQARGTALVVLMAQAVPTASQLPCVELKPPGWTVSDVFVRNGRARFTLDSDRVGVGAVTVVLEQFCDIGRSTRVPSDHPGTRRYQEVISIEPGQRYQGAVHYLFPGGCVTYRLDFRSDEQARPLGEVSLASAS